LRKRTVEAEKLKVLALKVVRYNQRIRGWGKDGLFAAFDKNGDGEICQSDFVAFFEGAEKELKDLDFRAQAPEARKPSEDGKAANGEAAGDGEAVVADDAADVAADSAAAAEATPAEEEAVAGGADAEAASDVATGGATASSSSSSTAASVAPAEIPLLDVAELPSDGIAGMFSSCLDEGETSLSREAFFRLVRLFFKVIKETAMTDAKSIKESSLVRRLETNEVVEVLEGPLREDSAGVMRVRCKAFKDDLEGWATVAGNQGTLFLVEGGSQFKVVKETILTESFSLSEDKETTRKLKDTTRKVKEGEVLEVWDWPRKEETSGLTRMKCKLKSDGAVGWVTSMGNQGAVFAELL